MDLSRYVASVRDDLTSAAAVGDESTAQAGTALAAALEPAVRLALMTALSDLTSEVSDALGDRSVGLRLDGREVRVVVDRSPGADPAGPDTPRPDDGGTDDGPRGGFFAGGSASPFGEPHPFGRGGGGPFGPGFGRAGGGPDVGDISRMTLRLVDQIKGQAEQAAAAQGMSLNSWVAKAVQGALRDAGAGGWGGGHGWGGSGRADRGRAPDRPATDERPDAGPVDTPDRPGPDPETPDRPGPDPETPDRPGPDPETPDRPGPDPDAR